MKNTLKFASILLTIGILMVSCGTKGGKMPLITESGVGPFVLGESIMNIPPHGEFYDTIVLNKKYGVTMGDHYVEIDENEIEDYYRTMGSDYFDPDEVIGTATVVSGNDTILVATYNESGKIHTIDVYSSKLKLENGIHTGLTSEEMFSKHKAQFLTTDCFAGESYQAYYVPETPQNITIKAYKNSEECSDWYYDAFPDSGCESRCKRVKEGYGESDIFSVPLELCKSRLVKKITIEQGGNEMFQL